MNLYDLHGTFSLALSQRLVFPSQETALALGGTAFDNICIYSSLKLKRFVQCCEERDAENFLGVFLVDQYILVSPVIGRAGLCGSCFRRRFLSAPPESIYGNTVDYIEFFSEQHDDFEYRGWHSSHLDFLASVIKTRIRELADSAMLFDISTSSIQISKVFPVHGCRLCRPAQDRNKLKGDRFIEFAKELSHEFTS